MSNSLAVLHLFYPFYQHENKKSSLDFQENSVRTSQIEAVQWIPVCLKTSKTIVIIQQAVLKAINTFSLFII